MSFISDGWRTMFIYVADTGGGLTNVMAGDGIGKWCTLNKPEVTLVRGLGI